MIKPMVWIISYFAGGPSYCPRIPDYSLAKYLREHGYDAIVLRWNHAKGFQSSC